MSQGFYRRLGKRALKQKRFQVTRVSSSFADRHARPEHGVRKFAAVASAAPRDGFWPLRISAQEADSRKISDEANVSKWPFAPL
jgi:hypothetical protein